MLNLHRESVAGRIPARLALVISSRPDARGLVLAAEQGLPTLLVNRRTLGDDAFQFELTRAVRASCADLVCLAGFLHLWRIPDDYAGRVINIHPALLPDFGGKGMYGRHVHEAVLAAGRTESGCTVHFCDNEYDHGPVICRRTVAIPPGCSADQLAHLVFHEELKAYPEAIRMLASGQVDWPGAPPRTEA